MGILNNNWNKQEKEPMLSKMKGKINSQPPMKHQIESTQRSLQAMIAKLDQKCLGLKSQDDGLFNKIVIATQKHETDRASAYANELAELRKIIMSVTQMRLVLEQINLRMGTVRDFGDVVASITPIVSVVKGMKSSMTGVLPEASSEMSKIGELMTGLISDAGQLGGSQTLIESSSPETESILAEAAAIVEVDNEKQFPSPTPTSSTPDELDLNSTY